VIGSVSAHRRAHAFARLLDESRFEEPRLDDGGAAADPPADSAEQAALLSVAERLTALPRPELRAETKAAQRDRLLAAMHAAFAPGGAAEAAPGPAPAALPGQRTGESRGAHRGLGGGALARLRPRSRLTKGLAAGGLTVGVAAGALGGVAAASTDALPGDTLYGLKRGMEDLRLDFTTGDTDRGRVFLDHAATRLNEARRLLERQRSGALEDDDLGAIRSALASMAEDAAEGHRLLSRAYASDGSLDPIESLSAFSDSHRSAWTEIRRQLPPELHDVGTEVTDVLDAMEEELAPLKPLLPREPRTTASAGGPAHPSGGTPLDTDAPGGSASPDARGDADASPSAPGTPDAGAPPATEAEQDEHGLLDPPGLLPGLPGPGSGTDDASGSPSAPETGEGTPPSSDADITLPPLVEDLLPDLGLGGNPGTAG
jgi:hypothetical protein